MLYGAGNGVYSIARGTMPLALFGPDRYPALVGRLAGPSLIAGAIAPSAAAFILSQAGAGVTFVSITAVATLNVILALMLWRQSRSART